MAAHEKEFCLNCGKPITDNSLFCSEDCSFNYSND
ncbi:DUF2116 family Zn-ribbon domain-containing protein [Rossellomorea vietnamensis]|uniref:DUF2116 family Zn-ribbon domain-containing protein n=1 Tax=Rossellomorea vietnamensis TaxID=218284 RepID=A0A5D4P135_9BACI|nr:DUF2116 family Zn-ribbon domain-containing protein [Rossellomorea vietnamensis]